MTSYKCSTKTSLQLVELHRYYELVYSTRGKRESCEDSKSRYCELAYSTRGVNRVRILNLKMFVLNCQQCTGSLLTSSVVPEIFTLFAASPLSTRVEEKNLDKESEWSNIFTCGLLFQWAL